jgi:hypothetical protein
MGGIPTSRRAAMLAALLVAGISLAACGSSPSTSSTTTTTNGPTGSSGPTGATGANVSASAQLHSLTSLASTGKSSTFEAVYTYTSSGKQQTITFAQQPPKSLFKVGTTGLVLNDGTKTYVCGSGNCYASSSTSADPLASLTYLFDGQTFLDSVQAYSATAAALAAEGITLTFSTGTYAGQPSKCVTVTSSKAATKAFTWCVASNGILASWTSSSGSFTLTSYTTSPPASDFSLPAGYKVVSIP